MSLDGLLPNVKEFCLQFQRKDIVDRLIRGWWCNIGTAEYMVSLLFTSSLKFFWQPWLFFLAICNPDHSLPPNIMGGQELEAASALPVSQFCSRPFPLPALLFSSVSLLFAASLTGGAFICNSEFPLLGRVAPELAELHQSCKVALEAAQAALQVALEAAELQSCS